MTVITYPDLPALREKYKDRKIVFCSGSFDLPHAGHVVFFEEAKKLGDVLVVTVGRDYDIAHDKGPGRPVLNEAVRLKMIDSLKPVDYTFLTNSLAEGTPWTTPLEEIFNLLHPDLWVVNYDASRIPEREALARKFGLLLTVLHLDRNHPEYGDISTTNIIKKIKSS